MISDDEFKKRLLAPLNERTYSGVEGIHPVVTMTRELSRIQVLSQNLSRHILQTLREKVRHI